MIAIKRRRAKCLDVLPGYDIEEAMNMAVFSYKEAKKDISFTAKFINIYGKDRRYQKPFFRMVFWLLTIIKDQNPSIQLKRPEFLKICLDYFIALNQSYSRWRPSYRANQIYSNYALESFDHFIQKEYGGDFNRYLAVITSSLQKEKNIDRQEMFKEEDLLKQFKVKETNIQGLTEFDFSNL